MKAEALKERPDYELYKQSDIVNFYHLQLPRWLFEDSRYMSLSLEAKITYAMLFNRFQLSKHNGWLNENGEVFVIYTRKELAERLNISEKRVSSAMSELREKELIWERRCGRGFANQIYLANVKISLADAVKSTGGPHDPSANITPIDCPDNYKYDYIEGSDNLRTDEKAVLNGLAQKDENSLPVGHVDNNVDKCHETGIFSSVPAGSEVLEAPKDSFKNLQNCGSKTAETSFQELPKHPTSNIDFSFKDFRINNQSQSESSPYKARYRKDGQTDADIIKELIVRSELYILDKSDQSVIRDAIERLYFMQSIKIGNAVYPNEHIRSNLWRLNSCVVQNTIDKITLNKTTKIHNSSAYVVTVLFNTIMESGSDLIVDPYLNFLRSTSKPSTSTQGDG